MTANRFVFHHQRLQRKGRITRDIKKRSAGPAEFPSQIFLRLVFAGNRRLCARAIFWSPRQRLKREIRGGRRKCRGMVTPGAIEHRANPMLAARRACSRPGELVDARLTGQLPVGRIAPDTVQKRKIGNRSPALRGRDNAMTTKC
jgi:hypothetical protein